MKKFHISLAIKNCVPDKHLRRTGTHVLRPFTCTHASEITCILFFWIVMNNFIIYHSLYLSHEGGWDADFLGFYPLNHGSRSSPFITFSICCNLERDRHTKISGESYH